MLRTLGIRIGAHPRRVLWITLAFVIVAGLIGGPLAGALKSTGGFAPAAADSQVATNQLKAATGLEPTPGIALLVDTPRGARAAAPEIAQIRDRLAAVPGVARTQAPAAVARDGHHILVTGTLWAGAGDTSVSKALVKRFAGTPGVTVGGTDVANEQISHTVTSDLARAELLAFPILIILSLVFFGGRAALMPLAVGTVNVLGSFLVLTGVNQLYGLSVFALNLVIGMGLGLAIDYTLFMVTRYREELTHQADTTAALGQTMVHAGRTVLFSAATVACALGTLTLFPQGFLKSMGIAGATAAIVAAIAAVTVSPALLGLWGTKLARTRAPAGGGDRWYRFAHWVMRRPGPIAAVTGLIMVIAALPALRTVWSPANDRTAIPKSESARTVADAMQTEFGGAGGSPVTVAIRAPSSAAPAVAAYARRVSGVPGVARVTPPQDLGHLTWQVNAIVSGDPSGDAAQGVVRAVRAMNPPFETKVTGDAASFVDQQAAIASHLPVAIGLLVVLTFIVLWLMTDSFVLPLKAIVMNALTVGASLTPLVLIYQHGHLQHLLGYTANGGVEPTDFVVAATVVFALSTDYGVFLLGRIKEFRESDPAHPVGDREAVAAGLGATGPVITAAAILLAVAIGAFSTSSIPFIQEIGVATATGVLLDAFVVRSLLVPSLMALLGRWNWWSPRSVRRLHGLIVPSEARPARPLANQPG
ncbi:MAG: MMPL family transporter [Solirubrobacteraceae bacterium]